MMRVKNTVLTSRKSSKNVYIRVVVLRDFESYYWKMKISSGKLSEQIKKMWIKCLHQKEFWYKDDINKNNT